MRLVIATGAVAVAALACTTLACTSPRASVHDPPNDAAGDASESALAALGHAAPDASQNRTPDAALREMPNGERATPDGVPSTASDLASDLSLRAAQARKRLGDGAAIDVVGDVFLLAASRRDPTYDASLDLARQATSAFFHGRFARRPDRAVSVYIFTSKAAYERFLAARGVPLPRFGDYDPVRREIAVNAALGITTLTHEIVHPIVESDFPDAPIWIDEGIASLFEAPIFPRPGEIHGATNWRHARLMAALASKTTHGAVRIDALFGMTAAQFRDADEDLHYALARSLCQWLDKRGQLWSFYAAWRDGVIDDPSGEKAFARVVRKTPADANDEWVARVKKL